MTTELNSSTGAEKSEGLREELEANSSECRRAAHTRESKRLTRSKVRPSVTKTVNPTRELQLLGDLKEFIDSWAGLNTHPESRSSDGIHITEWTIGYKQACMDVYKKITTLELVVYDTPADKLTVE